MKAIFSYFKLYFDLIFINLFFLGVALSFYLFISEKLEVIGAIMATSISISFGIRQYRIENDKMFKELFKEFNCTYDRKFNDVLNKLDREIKNNLDVSITENRELIIDYLNFCSEEFLWYKKGRIPFTVWKSWKKGMLYFLNLPPIKEIVSEQFDQKDSYYGLFKELFPDLKGNNK